MAGALAGQRFVQTSHFAAGNACRAQALQQHVAGEAANQCHHHGQQREPVFGTLHVGGITRVLHDVGALHHLTAELVKLAVVAHRDDERTVRRLEHAVRHDGRVGVAVTLGIAAQQHGVQAVIACDHQATVVQRHLDVPTLARALTTEQCRQHRLGGVHAGHHVHHGHAKLERGLPGFAVDGHEAGLALDHQVVARAFGFRSGAVVAGHRAIDQVRPDGLELCVTQSQLVGATGLEVLDHHIELRQQVVDQLLSFGRLQIHGDGPLVAVHAVVVGRLRLADAHAPVTGIVPAAGMLHLDDFGTEVGQHLPAQGACKHARQVQDPHAFKWHVHGFSPLHPGPCSGPGGGLRRRAGGRS